MHRLGSRVVVKPTRGGSALGVPASTGWPPSPRPWSRPTPTARTPWSSGSTTASTSSVVVLETDEGSPRWMPVAIEYEKGHEFDFAARYTAEFVSLTGPTCPRSSSSGSARSPAGPPDARPARRLPLRLHRRRRRVVRGPRDRDHARHHRDLGVPVRLHRQRYDAGRGRPRPARPGRRRPARRVETAGRGLSAGRWAGRARAGSARRSAPGRRARRPPTSAGTSRSG